MITDPAELTGMVDLRTGKLEPGVHRVSLVALEAYAVRTPERERLWAAFQMWHERVLKLYQPERFWFGGSFITATEPPSDIDVVVWLPAGRFKELRSARRREVFELMTLQNIAIRDKLGNDQQRLSRVQSFGGMIDSHPKDWTMMNQTLWKRQWGNDWSEQGEVLPDTEKGILEVIA